MHVSSVDATPSFEDRNRSRLRVNALGQAEGAALSFHTHSRGPSRRTSMRTATVSEAVTVDIRRAATADPALSPNASRRNSSGDREPSPQWQQGGGRQLQQRLLQASSQLPSTGTIDDDVDVTLDDMDEDGADVHTNGEGYPEDDDRIEARI